MVTVVAFMVSLWYPLQQCGSIVVVVWNLWLEHQHDMELTVAQRGRCGRQCRSGPLGAGWGSEEGRCWLSGARKGGARTEGRLAGAWRNRVSEDREGESLYKGEAWRDSWVGKDRQGMNERGEKLGWDGAKVSHGGLGRKGGA